VINVRAYAAQKTAAPLEPFQFQRRELRDHDVLLDILYCGVCHSDLHQVKNEWGTSIFPMVPGHEIIGRVSRAGSQVKRFKVGSIAGVGCFVDSCRQCLSCRKGDEQFCERVLWTYNAQEDAQTPTYGGYSTQIVVDETYALKIDPRLPLARVAPLLCAGITTYSPLRHWKVAKGQQVAVMGLGGLGHMAVKLADSFGAEVTMLSTSAAKQSDARRLGAAHFVLSSDAAALGRLKNHFDFILDTISAPHNLNTYLQLLKIDASMVLVGVPPQAPSLDAFTLISKRRRLGGSLIGGIAETQEMLDYCAKKNLLADVEVIPIQKINQAYNRMLKGDVRYRFVIDLKTL